MTRIVMILLAVTAVANAEPKRGVMVMAHGGDAAWNETVKRTVAPLKDKYPTEIAYGMADTATMRDAVQRLEAQGVEEIAVVRMFISGESFLGATRYILGLQSEPPQMDHAAHGTHAGHGHQEPAHGAAADADAGHDKPSSAHHMSAPEPIESKARFLLSRDGVAESELIDDILVDRVQSLSSQPANESVLILAHGPGDDAENARWLANMERRVGRIRQIGPFREVRCETLREDWPDKRAEAEQRIRSFVEEHGRDGRVIVVPFRVSGFGPYRKVLEGLEYVADEQGFCPHPNMTRWLEQTAAACFAQDEDRATD